MSFIKLDETHQKLADEAYEIEKTVSKFMERLADELEVTRWLSIGKTNIELGFMSLRKGITVHQQEAQFHQIADSLNEARESKENPNV